MRREIWTKQPLIPVKLDQNNPYLPLVRRLGFANVGIASGPKQSLSFGLETGASKVWTPNGLCLQSGGTGTSRVTGGGTVEEWDLAQDTFLYLVEYVSGGGTSGAAIGNGYSDGIWMTSTQIGLGGGGAGNCNVLALTNITHVPNKINLVGVYQKNTGSAVTADLWWNGTRVATTTTGPNIDAWSAAYQFGGNTGYSTLVMRVWGAIQLRGRITDARVIKAIYDNPWQFFKPQERRIWVPGSVAVASIALDGSIASVTDITGQLTTDIQLAASVSAQTTVTAEFASTAAALEGAIQSVVGATGDLSTGINLAASAADTSNVILATLNTGIPLTASISSVANLTGDLTTQIDAVAAISAQSTTIGTLTTQINTAAAINSQSTVTGALTTDIRLASSVSGTVTTTAALTTTPAATSKRSVIISTPWTQQPPPGVEIDWSNPITDGLVFAYSGNRNYDLVTRSIPTELGTPQPFMAVGREGKSRFFNSGFTQGILFPNNELHNVVGEITILWRGRLSAVASQSHLISKCLANGASSNPFDLQYNGSKPVFVRANTAYASWAPVSSVSDVANNSLASILITDDASMVAAPSMWVNRTKRSLTLTGSGTGTPTSTTNGIRLGCRHDENQTTSTSNVNICLVFNRKLSDVDALALDANPYQIFKPQERTVWIANPTSGIPLAGALQSVVTAANATLTTDIPLDGSTIVASTVISATLNTAIPLAGSLANVATIVASDLTTQINAAGALAAQTTLAGALTTDIRLNASIAAQSSVTADLTAGSGFNASAASVSMISGALTTAINASASIAAQSSASGNLTTQIKTASSVAAQSTASAALTTQITPAASIAAQATVAGQLTTAITLAATAASLITATANLTAGSGLGASVAASSTVAGALTTSIKLVANAADTSNVVLATLNSGIPLTASIQSQSAVTGALTTQTRFAAIASSDVTGAGNLTTAIKLAASIVNASSVTGSLATQIGLAASVAAQTVISAALTTGTSFVAAISSAVSALANLGTSIKLACIALVQSTADAELTTHAASESAIEGTAVSSSSASGSIFPAVRIDVPDIIIAEMDGTVLVTMNKDNDAVAVTLDL